MRVINNEQKLDKLNDLYEQLEKIKGKKDEVYTRERKKIMLEIKNTKNVMTTEDFEKMLTERSEIDTGRC